LVQLKLHTGTFLSYLQRRDVHLDYAQLGVFDTVTLGWVAGTHPSYSYRNEMKERVSKLMPGEDKNVQYALFPRSLHYINDKTSDSLLAVLLIPQVRPAHKYPISPWEMIHLAGGDNAVGR
jgi:hypothetical protein